MNRLLYFLLASFAFVACAQSDFEELVANHSYAPNTITIGFEDSDDTRVELNEELKTVWSKGDYISILLSTGANQKWEQINETGQRIGTFKPVDNIDDEAEMEIAAVVYPYQHNYSITNENDRLYIKAHLPDEQNYLKDSYGVGSNTMVAVFENDDFTLRSVCGWLRLQFTGEGNKITSIKVRGNSEEQLAGWALIDPAEASLKFNSNYEKITELTLNCGAGVELGAETTAFYITLPPQTYEHGITVEVDAGGIQPMIISTTKSITIQRNHIQPMANISIKDSTPKTNEIYYINGSTTEATTPYQTDIFGANIVSNLYDAEEERWVITFDGDVTTIGENAFRNCSSLTSIAIPDSVTEIGENAFLSCNSLTSITIPDSVTTIGDQAFYACNNLTSVYCKPTTLPTGGNYMFDYNAEDRKIYVPTALVEAYKSAEYWSDYADSIEAYDFDDNEATPEESTPNNDEIWYKNGSTTYATNHYMTAFGGAYPQSNTYDEAKGYWIMKFDKDITTIGANAFYNCSDITQILLPESITTIDNFAFRNCGGLTDIKILDSVETLGIQAFQDCIGLQSVTIGNGVTEIQSSAFYGCEKLESVTIGNSVKKIYDYAFNNCKMLTDINLP